MRYLLLLLLVGCAQTPKEIMESGAPTLHRLKGDPQTAAFCIERNAENRRTPMGAPMLARARPLPPGWEVVITIHAAETRPFAVIHLTPLDSGSQAKAWITTIPAAYDREALKVDVLAGC